LSLASLGAACSFTDLDELSGTDASTLDANTDSAGGKSGSAGSGGAATGGAAGAGTDAGSDAGAAGSSGAAGGSATCHLSLTDDFDDGMLSPEWAVWDADGTTILETQGRLTMVFPTTSIVDSWDGIGSEHGYDLTECSAFIRLVELPQAEDTYVSFILMLGADNAIMFGVSTSMIDATVNKDGTKLTLAEAAFDGTLHAWLRVRHSGDTIFWETSANGATWANFASLQTPFDITALKVVIGVGANAGGPTAGVSASFDNLDVPP
jgi:hypothetical protein